MLLDLILTWLINGLPTYGAPLERIWLFAQKYWILLEYFKKREHKKSKKKEKEKREKEKEERKKK